MSKQKGNKSKPATKSRARKLTRADLKKVKGGGMGEPHWGQAAPDGTSIGGSPRPGAGSWHSVGEPRGPGWQRAPIHTPDGLTISPAPRPRAGSGSGGGGGGLGANRSASGRGQSR